ncbi:MAG: hypothetical protein LBS54_01525 [Dysgonamonadaceae bacterium]|jgi:cell division protein FtsQ|nr:hypothetical protein [Dysgonamonadaceae bacterium]
MLKKISLILFAVLLFGYMIFAITAIAPKAGTETVCKGITVNVTGGSTGQLVSDTEIIATLKKNNLSPEGKALDKINTSKIEEKLIENKIIRRAECYKTIDGKIKITIHERTPFFRIFATGRSSYYVDREREIIPVTGIYPAYVHVATGFISEEFARNELYDFVKHIKNDKFWNSQIAQIHVDRNGDLEFIPIVGNHKVIIGRLTGYKEKLDKLRFFYDRGLNKIGWNKYSVINLKYRNQVVCKKRNSNRQ